MNYKMDLKTETVMALFKSVALDKIVIEYCK